VLSDGESANVRVKGIEKSIKGDLFAKALGKRARKGTALVAARAKPQKQRGLF
jgi:hypothetical protein